MGDLLFNILTVLALWVSVIILMLRFFYVAGRGDRRDD